MDNPNYESKINGKNTACCIISQATGHIHGYRGNVTRCAPTINADHQPLDASYKQGKQPSKADISIQLISSQMI
jgi:hypothetical protein